MNKKIIILMVIMTTLAGFIFADDEITGPGLTTPLEIYGVWNPNSDPLFILTADYQSIDYTQSTIQFQTEDFDLSVANQTENFNLYVYSNFSSSGGNSWWNTSYRYYDLNIYFSTTFVPVEDILYTAGNYPIVNLFLNATPSQSTFSSGWGGNTSNYIEADSYIQNQSTSMTYGIRTVSAKRYKYDITIPSGWRSVDLINFNFGWNAYTASVSQYWDMEAYVRVELTSI